MTGYNVASLLEDTAAKNPHRTAIVGADERLTYAQLDDAANRVANLLACHGVGRGDKVAMMLPNIPEFTAVYFGILKSGAAVVPLSILLKSREVAYHLADSNVKVLFAFQGTPQLPIGEQAAAGFADAAGAEHLFVLGAHDGLAELTGGQPATFATAQTDGDDTAVIFYTSGTTGTPKGAELRHRNIRDNALAAAEIFGCDADNPDTYLSALPLFHAFGQTINQNSAIAVGGTAVLMPRFDAATALRQIADEKVTFFAGVPTMYWGLLQALDAGAAADDITGTLRIAASGGAPLPAEIHRDFERRFKMNIAEGYGLSETSPIATFTPLGAPARVGSIGIPLPGVQLKLIDRSGWDEIDWHPEAIGEIAVRGHNVMKGYLGRPEATADAMDPDGWFRTGDLGRRDADGYYYIVDRAKELIIRGGLNVYPREVEEVLLTHPEISMAAVIGVAHATLGEEVKAFVVLKPDAATTAAEITEWSSRQLAAYKYPRVVSIIDAFPMTDSGKILKRALA